MPLTDASCRLAKQAEKPYKLADSGGLYLLVNKTGKYWRWKYRHAGKEKLLAMGVYRTGGSPLIGPGRLPYRGKSIMPSDLSGGAGKPRPRV